MAAISVTPAPEGTNTVSVTDPAVWIIVSLCIAVLGFYWSSVAWLVKEWSSASGTFSHGYFVVAISAWLLYRSLSEMSNAALRPDWRVLPIVLATSLVWLLGYAANIAVVQTSIIPALLLFAVVAVLGRVAAGKAAFAILYLYFAFPLWDYTHFIFQAITVSVIEFVLRGIGIAVFVDGNFVTIAPGTFEIAGGCSGVSFILASLSLAALYGHLYYHSNRHRWLLVAAALLIAAFSNWVRVSWIIMVGHASDMQSPMIQDHLTFGWILFSFAMIPLFVFARYLEPATPGPRVPTSGPAPSIGRAKAMSTATVLTMLALAVGPIWAWAMLSPSGPEPTVTLSLPETTTNWSGPQMIVGDWQPSFPAASAERQGLYSSGNSRVWLYENIYLQQKQDRELIYFKNSVSGQWPVRSSRDLIVHLPAGVERQVRQDIAASPSGQWVVWYWYVVDDHSEISAVVVKLRQALATLTGRPEAGMIALAARCETGCDAAAERIESLLVELDSDLHLNYIVSSE